VLFLEEMVGDRAVRPEHRLHQAGARAVLQALLPERGTDIKGSLRSRHELLEAAGYGPRPQDFDALLHILDTELRLITPADPESVGEWEGKNVRAPEGEGAGAPSPSECAALPLSHSLTFSRSYQLTHDYLVPSLREWLTRKQRETRRGRAELCLRERTDLWTARPEGRHLPSSLEWANILLFCRKRGWTQPQRQMMRAATRRYALRLGAALVLLGLLSWAAWEGHGYLRASTQVQVLAAADTSDAPEIIRSLDGYRRWAAPMLRRLAAESADDSRERLHAS